MLAPLGVSITIAALGMLIGLAGEAGAAECRTETPPDEMRPSEASVLYDCIKDELFAGYARAEGLAAVPAYRSWEMMTIAPLRSATHGNLFVNHIVNPIGASLYKQWEAIDGRRFPEGTVVAKEGFRVTRAGEVVPGPLFLMEKAPPGTAPDTDDWIYTRVFPDGRFERTLGEGGEKTLFCHDCHMATLRDQDAMFFPPEAYRITVE